MIKFENTEVVGWEAAIRGMRNPLNSWDKMDSGLVRSKLQLNGRSDECLFHFEIGPNDMSLMKRLRAAGTDHRKYLRMIQVYVDITAPLYWWKEFDTYKVGTVANSCSTMHKIHAKEFTLDDFSHEHISVGLSSTVFGDCLTDTIDILNEARECFLDSDLKEKQYWWQMIQLLPSSYNQMRTVMMNYETLNNIYKSRKNHKLDEWSVGFMKWIESLPYAEELITGEVDMG